MDSRNPTAAEPRNVNRRAFLATLGAAAALPACRSMPLHSDSSSGAASLAGSMDSLLAGVKALERDAYRVRLDRLRSLLNEEGIDGILLESSTNLSYLTAIGFGRSERLFLVWIPAWGEPAVVCPAFEESRAREGSPFTTFRIWQEHEDPYQRVAELLAESNARAGRIALEPTTRYFVVRGVARAAPAITAVDGAKILDAMRTVKSPAEVAFMRKAIEVTEKSYDVAFAAVKEGTSESEFGAAVSTAMARLGTGGGALVLFGPNAAYPHGTAKHEPVREGIPLLCDGGTDVQGYKSDITRTRVLGKPTAKVAEVWNVVHEAQAAGFRTAGPGVPCQEVDRAARKVIVDAGYGQYFTHRLGHGIGMEGHEAPYLVEGNTRLLEPGNTTTVEPGIYIPGELGVRIEDMILITENGCEVLSHPPAKLESI
ncbi:MAG: aminopeptidase P family protein [Planctomycetes bacterium]|nr:aminopeptidase P family protein [Planctomycetota bacterium]